MSLNVILNTAVSGLLANQQAIAATSENIANVNTENFSRREVDFFTDALPNQFSGVSVEVSRAGVNNFLQSSGFSSSADASSTQTIADVLARVEASLGAPGDNISFANELDAAFAAFAELSAAPSSPAARAVAVNALGTALDSFNRTLQTIDSEITAASDALSLQTSQANALLGQIFNLNQIVGTSNGAGDQLDAALAELSSLIDINVTRNADGVASVTTSNGSFLVNGGSFTTLSADTVGTLATGGSIGALNELINTTLPGLRTTVTDAGTAISAEINTVYEGNAAPGATGPGTTPLIVTNGGFFEVNAVILADPFQLAIARPDTGNVGGANDGTGAAAIAALGGGDAARGAAVAIAEIGAANASAQTAATSAGLFADEISTRIASESGVNLDEELSNLIQFQRSFEANARVISAVDELYQSILSIL